MKLSVLQENLKRGLAIVGHAVAGKSTLPVLSNVLLRADKGALWLSATNLEIGLSTPIGAKIEEEGAVTIPHKLLSDVIGGLPNDKVDLTLDERTQTLNIKCARFESNIKGIEADEFPSIPTATTGNATTFAPDALSAMLSRVVFAAADDDSRPVLAGVQIAASDSGTTFEAADGFRLSFGSIAETQGNARVIVPARALEKLARLIEDEPIEMVVTPSGGQVVFRVGGTELVSRLIDGKYPDTQRIIPSTYTTRTVVDAAELGKALKLASFFAADAAGIVKLTFYPRNENIPGNVVISANAAEIGNNTAQIECAVEGAGGLIALNVKFLLEAVAAIKTPLIAIETTSAGAPAKVLGMGLDDFAHVIMPMTVR